MADKEPTFHLCTLADGPRSEDVLRLSEPPPARICLPVWSGWQGPFGWANYEWDSARDCYAYTGPEVPVKPPPTYVDPDAPWADPPVGPDPSAPYRGSPAWKRGEARALAGARASGP